jgi:hypothetical protein
MENTDIVVGTNLFTDTLSFTQSSRYIFLLLLVMVT